MNCDALEKHSSETPIKRNSEEKETHLQNSSDVQKINLRRLKIEIKMSSRLSIL